MAVNLINIGNFANDGTGDDLREAFVKVNQNFEDLDLRNDEQTTASNLTAFPGNSAGLFKERVGYNLQFKSLTAHPDGTISLEDTGTDIKINAVGGEWRFVTNEGTYLIDNSISSQIIHLKGVMYPESIATSTEQVNVSYEDGELHFRINPRLKADPAPVLANTLNANFQNIINGGDVTATKFAGPLEGFVYGVDVRELAVLTEPLNFDFGIMNPSATRFIDWLLTQDIDLGTFSSPTSNAGIDFGALIV
jgi:hypothetical protein